jgi:hypothetical protein
MRLSVLSLFLCAGTMAFCQAPAPASSTAGFSGLQLDWQPCTAAPARSAIQAGKSFSRQWEDAQINPEARLQSQLIDAAGSEFSLLEKNQPFLLKPFRPQPKARSGPIPTQWPTLKVEQIPTQWPDLKLQPIKTQSSAPAGIPALAK